MRITIIGPSYPYRGGISHYNTLLYRSLLKNSHQVQFIGFRRQYPKFLYPGKSDEEKENISLYEPDILRVLDSINPLTWLQAVKHIREYQPEVIIIPWWVTFFAPLYIVLCTLTRGKTNARIMFLCHNVIEHETSRIKQWITSKTLRLGDFFMVHSSEDLSNLKNIIPEAIAKKAFMPSFHEINSRQVSKESSQYLLGLHSKKVLLFFGFVRPYKGLMFLLRSMVPLVKKFSDIHLLIVGEFMKGSKEEYLKFISDYSLHNYVTIIDHYVLTEQIHQYFCTADIVVLPYTTATQSAVVQLAYSYNKPVLVTNVGGLPEVVINGETGYTVPSKSSDAIYESIVDFYENSREQVMSENVEYFKTKFSWDELCHQIVQGAKAKKGQQNDK
ncbi:glycosyltransferase [Paenibacillus sp. RC67]|uniref:glycosyltransferase n=1 Tax=Paenibacillus sp. RC67 TaxID=3039392 RepID=UPI0024ADB29A|nr:glycosyltransferase [Paenibacillus sp. RC67]